MLLNILPHPGIRFTQMMSIADLHRSILSLRAKRSNLRKIIIIWDCFVVSLLAMTLVKPVQAQVISLSIWPPLLEVQMMPGKTVTQVYKLTNNTDSFLSITPKIFPFEPLGENGQIKINQGKKLENDPSPYFFSFASGNPSASSGQLEIDKPFMMDPQGTKEILLKVTLPKGSPEKDYYFTLLFSTSVKYPDNNSNQTSSVTQIGTNILLTSSIDENPALLARLIEFSAPKIVDSFSPTSFVVKIENWGKTYFKPFGKIEIKGILKQKDEIKLLEQNVLSSSIRKLDLPSFKPKFPIGPFKARIELYLTEGKIGTPLSREIVFWYLPYKILLAIPLVLLLIKVIGFIKRKRTSS